jgi:transcriptional regulator with XRE-family HTH domain
MFTIANLTPQERRDLAQKVGCNPVYLWQIATSRRTPSLALLKKLSEADKRLTPSSFLFLKK